MTIEDDAYELYDSRGGTMNREMYRKVVGLVFQLAFLFLHRGNRIQIDDIVFQPVKRNRKLGDRGYYYQPGYIPDVEITSSSFAVLLDRPVKKKLIVNYENLPL